jgi:hypothetical protein
VIPAAPLLLCAAAAALFTSSDEGYVIPGVETGEVLINVHVWGEVMSPGTYEVPFDSDLITAMSEAGGPKETADLGRIRVVCDDNEFEYDLGDYLEGAGEPVPVLSPGVTIYVPRNTSDWWKEAIDIGYKVLVAVNLVWIMIDR